MMIQVQLRSKCKGRGLETWSGEWSRDALGL